MARKCIMCGRETTGGILCEKCDKPRKPKSAEMRTGEAVLLHTEAATAFDPFPIADIVPFPLEATSLAITSVVDLLIATGAPSIFLGPDRSVKFVSDTATSLFGADLSLKFLEDAVGIRVGDLSQHTSAGIRFRDRNVLYSLVPISGGASGAALVFRYTDSMSQPDAEEEPQQVPTVTDVVSRIGDRFMLDADQKDITIQIDAHELEQRLADHEELSDALAILMENALHYAPAGGEVVLGVRSMEHKGKPLLLFFVMDTGPLVPENMRQAIFEPSFVWDASAPERTGRELFKTREFAVRHQGSVWVESKSGKACTFFLRVQPDPVG